MANLEGRIKQLEQELLDSRDGAEDKSLPVGKLQVQVKTLELLFFLAYFDIFRSHIWPMVNKNCTHRVHNVRFFYNRKVDLFDHSTHAWEVVKHYS